MYIIKISGFSDGANLLINKALALAVRSCSRQATTVHLLVCMLSNSDLARRFEAATEVKKEDFIDKATEIIKRQADPSGTIVELDINNISPELHFVITKDIKLQLNNDGTLRGEIDECLLLYTILAYAKSGSEVGEIFERLGVKPTSRGVLPYWLNANIKVGQSYERLFDDIDGVDRCDECDGDENGHCDCMGDEYDDDDFDEGDEGHNEKDDPLEFMKETKKVGVDLCNFAKKGELDPVGCRDEVMDKMIEVLGRRSKSNPCLIGEPGVGKTSIVEGLAQRIVDGNVPDYLKDAHIISVDISGVVSGAKYRGEFEQRFNDILYEAARHKNVILFFDEFHMLLQAGAASSDESMTAGNILKPAIAKGGIRVIGATTTKEYKKFVEIDAAFERRMQSIMVEEPSVEDAIVMVEKSAHVIGEFHKTEFSHEVIEEAVKLSDRYITDKRLPDKAISVIDDTAARLKAVCTENSFEVSISDIRYTISKSTGIDVQELDITGKNKLVNLKKSLEKDVIGQSGAVEDIANAIKRAKSGIKDPKKPIGTFLFVGPTGVGKTELAKQVAKQFSSKGKLIKFDMSEYMEKYSVSKLIGSAPGYVGYGEGGQLTEAVRRNPYSVLLFDEIEKASPDIFNIFLQILDEGTLTDSQGVRVDFKNTIIIFTSNAGYGAEIFGKRTLGFNTGSETSDNTKEENEKVAIKALEETFRPEFINRLDKVVIFDKLDKDSCEKIVALMLNDLKKRMQENGVEINWSKTLINRIIEVGFNEKYGARNLKRTIQEVVENDLADKLINSEIKSGDSVTLSFTKGCLMVLPKINAEKTEIKGVLDNA